mmetsp:Transcript_19602/g.52893  ORF Transcript_19602/g.52893 Transcript_19602/m.52893 type:complete len:205 (+) Transcript_19602:1089-1703(+)
MVHVLELPVEPHVEVDHGDALEVVELLEVGHGGPRLRHHALHHVHRHGGDVLVCDHELTRAHTKASDRLGVRVHLDLLEGALGDHLAAPCLDVLLHGLAEAVRLVAVEEGHLQAVVLVEEAVHGGEHDCHGQLVRIDEVKGLGHGDEDLLVDALGHAVLAHEVSDGELVLRVDELLSLDEHGDERRGCLDLLPEREHLLVAQDG